VTGFFTAGSLFLGFSILRSDRRRAERAQAAKFLIWYFIEESEKRPDPHLVVYVWNTSDQPIFLPTITGGLGTGYVFSAHESGGKDMIIGPGEEDQMAFPVNKGYGLPEDLVVSFKDAAGVPWKYEVTQGRLSKIRLYPQWLRRLKASLHRSRELPDH
jgi:hypothetical protein